MLDDEAVRRVEALIETRRGDKALRAAGMLSGDERRYAIALLARRMTVTPEEVQDMIAEAER